MFKNRHYKEVWSIVGFIVNLSQMIEYNLAHILALNEILSKFDEKGAMWSFEYNELLRKTDEWYKKLSCRPLGNSLKEIEDRKVLTSDSMDELRWICDERNYFIHHYFKEDLRSKDFQERPKQIIPRLQELVIRMKNANDDLCNIFKEMDEKEKTIY